VAEATHNFPTDFLWGTATSAHQVEGNNTNNDWWRWEQEGQNDPKVRRRIYRDQASGRAVNWWEAEAEADIKRMKALNTNSHRLSVEWSRIEPEPGVWDHDALDRYRVILKKMRDAGIKPMVTLHHFSNPLWLVDLRGDEGKAGWLNPKVVERFGRFVAKTVTELSDLCDLWCTINEPNVYAAQSYFEGVWPPGHHSIAEYFRVSYHMLLAHAAAFSAIRDIQPLGKVGLAKHMIAFHPRHAVSPLDRSITRLLDRAFHGAFLDALTTGLWKPPVGRSIEVRDVRGTLDWIGLNYYNRYDVGFDLFALQRMGVRYAARPGVPTGPGGWGELYPQGLFDSIKRLHRHFRLPIYITENGIPDERDEHRPAFLLRHLRQVWRAISFNWPVMGYYFWSLLDNFEWAEGYDPRFRFGLYSVDLQTQERKLTRSGELYAEIAHTGSLTSDMARRFAPDLLDELFPGKGPEDMFALPRT
jgi:beta-glucosidase